MTATLAQIWRHPIKAHGFEALEQTPVRKGETLPWDRIWAVRHSASQAEDNGAWARCVNFSRGAKAPHLMALRAALDTDTETLTLSHPDVIDLAFRPDDAADQDRFIDWMTPLMPADRAASTDIIRVTEQGMTDTPFPSISIGNLATLRVLEQKTGQPLDVRRFRLNLWVEGLAPFEEFEWIDQQLQIGNAGFTVADRITRCASVKANPDTGRRDADPLSVMDAEWGHQDFGVALIAETDGTLSLGDAVNLQ